MPTQNETVILLPESEQAPTALTFEGVGASADMYEQTGDFTSRMPEEIGSILDVDTIRRTIPETKERELMPDSGFVEFANGAATYNTALVDSTWTLADLKRVKAFEPTLLAIDADFRERAGLAPETVLHPSITVVAGPYDEKQVTGNGTPHLDIWGGQLMLYFAADGAGTVIYPGKFKVDPSPYTEVDPEETLVQQIEEHDITPVELASGKIYVGGWDTVHAAPGQEHVGERRCFLRVQYEQESIHQDAQEASSEVEGALQELPPVRDGYVRLYRGDIVDEHRNPIIQDVTGRATAMDTAGRWFTDKPNDAEGYAGGRQAKNAGSFRRYSFVDVPEDVAAQYNARALSSEEIRAANGGHAFSNEWILPRDIVDNAVEYKVVESEDRYDPTVAHGLHTVFERPEVQSALEEMGIDRQILQDITHKPVELQLLLEQLSMMLGQNHLIVEDKEALGAELAQLNQGVQSAYKRRYLGPMSDAPKMTEQAVMEDKLPRHSIDW
jgi:hypothetical protein